MGFAGLLFCRSDSPAFRLRPHLHHLHLRRVHQLDLGHDADLAQIALLDPKALRTLLEVWLTQDMHQHVATDYLTGEGIGTLGLCRQRYGILRCADAYLRVTGDFAWLDKSGERQAGHRAPAGPRRFIGRSW